MTGQSVLFLLFPRLILFSLQAVNKRKIKQLTNTKLFFIQLKIKNLLKNQQVCVQNNLIEYEER